MKLEQQVVSLELAKRLKELGVNQESLFHWIKPDVRSAGGDVPHEIWPEQEWTIETPECSAFTVAELGEMLPREIKNTSAGFLLTSIRPQNKSICWRVLYLLGNTVFRDEMCDADTEADARAKMLIYLLENNLIPKEGLMDEKPAKSKFREYLDKAVMVDEKNYTAQQKARDFIKWFFELLRNLVVVGVILFLARKSDNSTLWYVSMFAGALLTIHVLSYYESWIIRPFHFLKNKGIARSLDLIVHVVLLFILTIGSVHVVGEVMQGVSDSYLFDGDKKKQ